MVEARQHVEVDGIQYIPVTFQEFAAKTKYSLFGVPRYRYSEKPVAILATFSTRKLTFTRRDFARIDKQMGSYAFLKPPGGGDAGPAIALGPSFDDSAWYKCKTLWQAYSGSNGVAEDLIPRFFFLGTLIFDRKVFRSHYVALDKILFANSHAGDPAHPDMSSISAAGKGSAAGEAGAPSPAPDLSAGMGI